jgi:N-acetylglucosamine kinase-like BadF-type ATPase
MRLFLGVDGGQSGTTAVIGDESGRILGTGEAGPCNHAAEAEGRAKLDAAIRMSLAAACAQAGLDSAVVHFAAACFGMSGGPEDKHAIIASILKTDQLIMSNDAVTALAGATSGGQGIITIAGTGSIAFGRNGDGRTARAGGWGHIFGDEGSAFDIARQALRAVLRMEEGWGPPTALQSLLLDATNSKSANEMLHLFYTPDWHRSRVASLAPLVGSAALNGDPIALAILHRTAHELAMLAGSVRAQLWNPGAQVQVAYIGGVFQSRIVLERFRQQIELDEGTSCAPPRYGPAEGALLEAYRSVGLAPALRRGAAPA